MIDYTIAQLIEDVKRQASIPTSQNTYGEQEFAEAFDHCQKRHIVPMMLKTREEFFVTKRDYDWSELEAQDDGYLKLEIPERVIGGRIRGMHVIQESTGKVLYNLKKNVLDSDDRANNLYLSQALQNPSEYYLEGNNIYIPDTHAAGGTKLRFRYFRRPNKIVHLERAGRVIAINTMTGSLTLDNFPEDFAVGVKVDIISHIEPFKSVVDSFAILGVGANSVLVTPALAAEVQLGDYVNYEFETVIPQIPVDLFPILTDYAASQIIKSLKDVVGYQLAASEFASMTDELFEMIEDRDNSSPQKIPKGRGGIW